MTIIIFSIIFLSNHPIEIKADSSSIQQQIDAASPGDIIRLKQGEYIENIKINKPVHLIGSDGVILKQKDANPVITIQANNVMIENLNMEYVVENSESPAILIHGDHHLLKHISIMTTGLGIQLDGANHNSLSAIDITGNEKGAVTSRQHGIELWDSHHNVIHDTEIKYMKDGMYIEKSNANKIYRNTVSHSRYGYHLMFTKDTELTYNEAVENVSGMYIMGADGPIAKYNTLKRNQKNIQSLGLLLFDTVNATIENNDMLHNRIGVLMESASSNTFTLNNIQGNYIGMQFKAAKNNDILHNAFVANVVQGQAKDSVNHVHENYWDDHIGLDMTGNERSDIAYKVDPFYLSVTNEYPAFQLLFQAPGMIFLEQLIVTPLENQFMDDTPLLETPLAVARDSSEHYFIILLFCVCLFIFSTLIIYLGVKKQ